MPRETLGFVKLEWTCPKCNSRNPGPEKTCLSCGAPQPQDVQFHQAETQELIKDKIELEQAKAGADIHCGFCGTRNPASTMVCSQCGADLREGKRRESGQVVGAYTTGPIKQVACPRCGIMNPKTALKCTSCGAPLATPEKPALTTITPSTQFKLNPYIIAGAAVIVLICLVIGISFIRKTLTRENQVGTVQGVHWVTRVAIDALSPVTRQTWIDEIPTGAEIGDCSKQVHHIQDQPAIDSNKICGTPYTVDQGNGLAEVVQDCTYEVLVEYCDYTVTEWQQVDVAQLEGDSMIPQFAQPQLSSEEKLGEQDVVYSVIFKTLNGQYNYQVYNLSDFQQFTPGSQWTLTFNGLGDLVSVESTQ